MDKSIVLIENVDGYRQECEDEDHDHSRYFHYDWSIFNKGNKIVVYSKDGTETEYEFEYDEDGEPCFIAENGDEIKDADLYCIDYQWFEHWDGIGTYEAYVEYYGVRCPLEISVVDNQVKSISFTPVKPIEYTENCDGEWYYCEEHEHGYFDYYINRFNKGDILTVTYKDGTTTNYTYRTNREDWFGTFRADNGEEISERNVDVFSNQYDNHWSIGNDNYYSIEAFGQSCDVKVTVIENPVDYVVFITDSPITYYENQNGYFGDDENGDVFYYTDYYRAFRGLGNQVVVHYKDGTDKVYTCVADDGYYNYKSFVDEDGNQLDYALDAYQWDVPWTVGSDNYMVLTVEGVECLIPVTIKENNIVDFDYFPVNDLSFVENTNGYWNDEEEVPFYYYFFNFEDGDQIVVTYDDETTKTFTVNAYRGEYTEYEFVADNGDGTFEKITSINSDDDIGTLFGINSNQWEEPWTVEGDNYVTIYVAGIEKYYPVEINENEIDTVELIKANDSVYIEHTNGRWEIIGEGGAKQFNYNVPSFEEGDTFVVTYNDSTVKNYVCTGIDEEDIATFVNEDGDVILYNQWDYIDGLIYVESNQSYEPWTLGENTYDIYFYGVNTQGTVTIVPCKHKYVYGICSICGNDSGKGYETIDLGTREINVTNGGVKKRFYFTPKASGTYLFKANDEKNENGDIYDTVGAIYNMDGRELARNDDYDDLLSFGVECKLNKGQTYILEAGMFNSADSGSFTVTLGEAFHNYTKTTEAATCTVGAKEVYTCEICGASYSKTLSDPIGHSYTTTVINPTCTTGGYTVHTCINCGNSYTDNYTNAFGHNYSTYTVNATCTSGGYTVYTCFCGASYVGNYTNAFGHNFGTNNKTCANCGTANPTYDAKKPAKPTISKVTAGKKKFKVTVKKVSKARKYEIQYSTKKNFKGAKTVTITGTSKEITKLSAKKKYYIRVRAVNNAGKSAWSATKTVTTKK